MIREDQFQLHWAVNFECKADVREYLPQKKSLMMDSTLCTLNLWVKPLSNYKLKWINWVSSTANDFSQLMVMMSYITHLQQVMCKESESDFIQNFAMKCNRKRSVKKSSIFQRDDPLENGETHPPSKTKKTHRALHQVLEFSAIQVMFFFNSNFLSWKHLW